MALQNDLTQGNVNSHIISFSLPLLLSNLLQALYNAVDMYFAGRYLGTAGLCAVSVAGPVMNVLLMTIAGMSVGVSVITGAYAGKHDSADIRASSGTAITLYAVCALFITVAGVALTPLLLKIIATPIEAYDMAVDYLRIVFFGVSFTLGYNLIGAFARGLGDSLSSLLFVATATLTNAALDIILMGRLQMGVQGAALATIMSQALSFILGLLYFSRNNHIISFSPRAWCLSRRHLKELIRLGLPSALQQASLNISHLTLNGIVNTYGLITSAAYGIGVKLDSFAILPANALNDAVATFTSQNLGANQEERALKGMRAARIIALTINAAITLCIFLFAPSLAWLFNKDAAVINEAVRYLHITCIMYILYAYVHPMVGFSKGSGNAMFTFSNSLWAQFIIRIPVAVLLSKTAGLGFEGVALAWLSAPLFSAFTYAHFLKSGKWRGKLNATKDEDTAL